MDHSDGSFVSLTESPLNFKNYKILTRKSRLARRKSRVRRRWIRSVVMHETLETRLLLAAEIVNQPMLSLSESEHMLVEIGGLNAGVDGYDQINVTDNSEAVVLNGTLDIELLNGFQPQVGQTFDFLTVNSSINGQFAHGTGLYGFGDGSLYFDVVEQVDRLQLEVKQLPTAATLIPTTAELKNAFGEIYSDYFPSPAITTTGEFNVDGLASLSGTFTISANVSTVSIAANDVNAFVGDDKDSPDLNDDVGVRISDAMFNVEIYSDRSYALAASGTTTVTGAGAPSELSFSGDLFIQKNTSAVDKRLEFGTADIHDDIVVLSGVSRLGGDNIILNTPIADLQGNFSVSSDNGTTSIIATAVNVTAGTEQSGVKISDTELHVELYSDQTYALAASGTATLLGASQISLNGQLSVKKNTSPTARTLNFGTPDV
ncbi:MAG: hypothetical protein ACI9HK_003144, partial [Pirellulaceae bacterium]